MKISVCMATYNGARFIRIQLSSILEQLSTDDEVIIVDDCSTDDTLHIVDSFADSRIKVIKHKCNEGVNKTFEHALQHASGELIFISDQDDMWTSNKVNTVINLFKNEKVDLIVHNAIVVDGNGKIITESVYDENKKKHGTINNIVKNNFRGCCMAFKRPIVPLAIPIPFYVENYDQWIGVIASLYGFKVRFINDKLMHYVRHGANVSRMTTRDIFSIICDRAKFITAVLVRYVSNFGVNASS